MFQPHWRRRRRFASRASRRPNEQRATFPTRRLGVELLELRRLLSHTPIEFQPPGWDGEDRELPPGLQVVQQTHWINGAPFEFVATVLRPPGSPDIDASSATTNGALHALDSIPLLHSNPSATAKLYLDFDGHFEAQWGGYSNVTTPAYDSDGDPTTFSDNELGFIYMAWSKAAEDFAPFNIDVTLEQPPKLAAGVPESAANGVAMRVSIGGDGAWTGATYGGLAYYDVFTNSTANVVYVFSNNTGDGTYIGDVASHEAGHGFGLLHQSTYDQNGVKTNEYNPGNGTWAPIMGNTYVPVTTWHNGTSAAGATSYQDDMAVLARSANGFGYRADDHGNAIATASPLPFDGLTYAGSGIIGQNDDVDVWSFSISTQDTYRLAVDPATIGANLDAVLELRDAFGSVIAAVSPAATQAAELVLSLAPASYYLSVTKTAVYGWLGQYTVSISTPPAGITVTAAQPLTTREGGVATTFSVVLDTQPTADVAIPLHSSNAAEGVVSTTSLLFTPANWSVPQTVSVSGVDDGAPDGDAPFTIILDAAVSDDPDYAGRDAADVAAVNLDNSSAGWMYWVENGSDTIQRSTLHGSDVQTIVDLNALLGGVDGGYVPRYIAVDSPSGKIYWTDSGAGVIRRANLGGSNVETIASGFTGNGLRGIAVDSAGGKLYWTDFAAQKIQRANLDGTGVQDLVTGGLSGVRDLALDLSAGKIYWADFTENNIRRANLDGTNIEVLWSGVDADNPSGIALDTNAGKIYWSDIGSDKIFRANLDGSSVEELIDMRALYAESTVGSLAVDAAVGKMYFSDIANQALYRANLDGSDLVAIVSEGVSAAQGVALLFPGVTVSPSTGLTTNESGLSATFRVTLTTPPSASVTIPIASGDASEGSVSTSTVTFTPDNWNVPQIVTVTGVDDAISDGEAPYMVVLGVAASDDPNYAGLNSRDVSLTNLDNEVKFYVVNDAAADVSYRYAADGAPRGSSSLGAANAAPRGVASTVVGDKNWVIDANRNVYVYSTASGALLGLWTAGTLAKNAVPEGIATNGTDVWIVDSRSDKVYRYAGAASRLSGSQNAISSFSLNSGNANAKDIVTDGQSLWVVNDSTTDKVFKYSTAGSLLGSWTIDAANKAPTGIALDPANVSHIWIVDSGTDRVYQYNAAATRISGSQAAALTFALAVGNANPQGIADPPAPLTTSLATATSGEAPKWGVTSRNFAWVDNLYQNSHSGGGLAIGASTREFSTLPGDATASPTSTSKVRHAALACDDAFESMEFERRGALGKRVPATTSIDTDVDPEFADGIACHNEALELAFDATFVRGL